MIKTFIIGTVIFMVGIWDVQASTIILKDGRTITGEIIEQDNTKVVVKNGDYSLTYYEDEIASIKGGALIPGDNGTGPDADKEKLVRQYMEIFPTSEMVVKWVSIRMRPMHRQVALSVLNGGQNISEFTQMISRGLTQHLSSSDLKAAVDFYSSVQGKKFLKDMKQYESDVLPKMYTKMVQEAGKATKEVKAAP